MRVLFCHFLHSFLTAASPVGPSVLVPCPSKSFKGEQRRRSETYSPLMADFSAVRQPPAHSSGKNVGLRCQPTGKSKLFLVLLYVYKEKVNRPRNIILLNAGMFQKLISTSCTYPHRQETMVLSPLGVVSTPGAVRHFGHRTSVVPVRYTSFLALFANMRGSARSICVISFLFSVFILYPLVDREPSSVLIWSLRYSASLRMISSSVRGV